MKSRRSWGEFKLEQADIESYIALKESAGDIGRRRGGFTSSNVLYHLRKVDTPEMKSALAYWANLASDDYKNHRKGKVIELIRAGRSTNSIVEEVGVSTSTVTKARRELGLAGKQKRVISPKKLVIERAQQVCDELKDYGWFSANSVYEKFGWSLREFCGVLKHINLRGVGEYSIERGSGSNHPKWRFVEQVKLGSTSIRITKTDKSGFWLLATAPVPMRYVSNLSA